MGSLWNSAGITVVYPNGEVIRHRGGRGTFA